MKKLIKWWYFSILNRVVRKGEAGAFKWIFRRFTLEITTLSGNFKCRFTASDTPYGYLLNSEDDQIQGFAQRMYMIGSLLTKDQQFVEDIDLALKNLDNRLSGIVKEDEIEEEAALEQVKAVQEVVEMPKKERKKYERKVDRRFKKAVKEAAKNERPM